MKRSIIYLLTITIALIAVGCDGIYYNKHNRASNIKTSIGEPYELFVICNDTPWNNYIKEAVADVLECEVPGLSRPEKYFHVVDHANFKDATDLERKHTNLLAINIDPTSGETSMYIKKDVYSTPQVLATITAPSAKDAAEYIRNNEFEVREAFENSERIVNLQTLTASSSPEAMKLLKETTGIDMHITGGFSVAKPKDDTMKWFVRKYTNKIQHIFAFVEPCDDINNLSGTALEAMLDKRLGVIPSKGVENSYMCINKQRKIYISAKDINGRTWYELRGCWRVEGDQMGGPLVSYSTYDNDKKELITIVFAMYSPEIYQRRDMAQMENMIFLTR